MLFTVLLILPLVVLGNSADEKWSWPESHAKVDDNVKRDTNRRVSSGEFARYQATANNRKSKPLSDEFSDEVGENYGNSNIVNGQYGSGSSQPNRQQDGFPGQFGGFGGGLGGFPGGQQFGGQQFGGGQFGGQPGGFQQGFGGNVGPQVFPGQGGQGFGGGSPFNGGGFQQGGFNPYQQQQGGFPGGFQQGGYNSIRGSPQYGNQGLLVGPGGPTGIIGRPYGGGLNQGGGFGGLAGLGGALGSLLGLGGSGIGGGFGGYPQGAGAGGFGGQNYGGQFGGQPGFQQGFGQPGLFYDSVGNNSNNKKDFKSVQKSY